MRRLAKSRPDQYLHQITTSLPSEPTITDKEREDILRFVENEVTEVKFICLLRENLKSMLVNLFYCLHQIDSQSNIILG